MASLAFRFLWCSYFLVSINLTLIYCSILYKPRDTSVDFFNEIFIKLCNLADVSRLTLSGYVLVSLKSYLTSFTRIKTTVGTLKSPLIRKQ